MVDLALAEAFPAILAISILSCFESLAALALPPRLANWVTVISLGIYGNHASKFSLLQEYWNWIRNLIRWQGNLQESG